MWWFYFQVAVNKRDQIGQKTKKGFCFLGKWENRYNESYFLSFGLSLALFDPSYTFVAENAFFVAQIGGLECKFIIFVSDCYNGPIQFSILPLLELNSFEATSRTNVLSIFSTTQIHSRTTKSFKLLPEGGTNKKWLWLEQLLPTPEVRGSSHRQKFMLNVYCQLHWKDVNKNRKAENCPFWKYIVLFNVKECSIGKNHIERFVVLIPGVINSWYVSQNLAVIPGTRWSLKKISKNLEVLGWNVLEDNTNEASRLCSSVSHMVVQVFLTDSATSLP